MPTHQIEHEQEDPAIYDRYVSECAARGATVTMARPDYAKA